ncbi:MAG TPA: FKBP-type peptidyl-prolyl cis-trans isomerase [Micromonosporaceae bacterium]|nr:FKBP-type peptidyl-prolyl cis-trans isomerase [Micromonosporaceae bacterium]
MTKAEKRTAAREAKARAARRRRQLQIGKAALAGVVVIAVIVGAVLFFRPSGSNETANAASTPSETPSATSTAEAVPFPPVPEGADPALKTRPPVSKGTGALNALKVTTLIAGTGPAVSSGQTLTVNYVGVNYDTGVEFDASWNRFEAFTFQIGSGGVIPGWDQGLIGVKVGSRVQLDIPAALAYGENPQPGQPKGPLRFVVDVLAAT